MRSPCDFSLAATMGDHKFSMSNTDLLSYSSVGQRSHSGHRGLTCVHRAERLSEGLSGGQSLSLLTGFWQN